MSQSVKTLTNGGGVLSRRSDFNIGVEDGLLDIEDEEDDDDRDLTLGRQENISTGFHMGTARKVNGTSERSSSGSNKNKKHFMFFQNKGKVDQPDSATKTPRRVERSKSELGGEHQHKKLIPHLSQGGKSGGGDLSDTNKKILAHWNSGVERGMKLFQYGFNSKTNNNKWDEQQKREDQLHQQLFQQHQQQQQQQQQQTSRESDITSKLSTLGAKLSPPVNKGADGIHQSIQTVLTLKKHFDATQIFSALSLDNDKTLLPSSKKSEFVPSQQTPDEKDCLEKYLELDHGEFQFIDDAAATLTRGASPPLTPMTKNLSISSLASEIFQELGQQSGGGLSKPEAGNSSRFRRHHQRRQRNLSSASMSAVQLDLELTNGSYNNDASYEKESNGHSRRPAFQNNSQIDLNRVGMTESVKLTSGDGTYRRQRRQRNLSTASMSAVVLADEMPHYMTSSWNGIEKENGQDNDEDSAIVQRRPTFQNDSQLVASLIADQTLFLRHHQKRKQQRRRQQQWSVGKWQLQANPDDQTASAAGRLLQKQLAEQTPQQLILRRCSSLTQTYSEDSPSFVDSSNNIPASTTSSSSSQDPSALSTRSSVHSKSDKQVYPDRNENGSSRLSSPGNGSSKSNIRFLYSGKYRPTFQQDPQQLQKQQQLPVNGNNNHESLDHSNNSSNNLNQSPWLVSNNLSSFARRRRSSSTSLHTYEDDYDDNNSQVPNNGVIVPNNNKRINNGEPGSDYR